MVNKFDGYGIINNKGVYAYQGVVPCGSKPYVCTEVDKVKYFMEKDLIWFGLGKELTSKRVCAAAALVIKHYKMMIQGSFDVHYIIFETYSEYAVPIKFIVNLRKKQIICANKERLKNIELYNRLFYSYSDISQYAKVGTCAPTIIKATKTEAEIERPKQKTLELTSDHFKETVKPMQKFESVVEIPTNYIPTTEPDSGKLLVDLYRSIRKSELSKEQLEEISSMVTIALKYGSHS